MGLFSSKKKTFYATTVSRVIQDNQIIPSATAGMIRGIMRNESIPDNIRDALINGMGTRGGAYYNYGRDHYTYGVPSGLVVDPEIAAIKVEAAIEDIEGTPVLMDYVTFGSLNYSHLAWKAIEDLYDYDFVTEELPVLTAEKIASATPEEIAHDIDAFKVKLDHVTLLVNPLDMEDLPPDAFKMLGGNCFIELVPGYVGVGVRIAYRWLSVTYVYDGFGDFVEALSPTITEAVVATLDINPAGYLPEYDYYLARYLLGGTTKFFEYRFGEGTYLDLDRAFDSTDITTGRYFPFSYYRFNGQSAGADTTTAAYKTSKKLIKKLGLNYAQLIDAVHENPDIGSVDHAIIYLAVPVVTSNKAEAKYLFNYFSKQFYVFDGEVTTLTSVEIADILKGGSLLVDPPVITLKPSGTLVQDSRLSIGISTQKIFKRLVTGVIGPVGFCTATTDIAVSIKGEYQETETTGFFNYFTYPSNLFRKQVSATEYEEIQIIGLSVSLSSGSNYGVTGNNLTNSAEFLIPLDLSVMEELSLPAREYLYARSLHFIFNSFTVVKIAWYQQQWFKTVLIIVAIVAIYFGDYSDAAQIVALLAEGSYLAAAIVILEYVIAAFIVKVAFNYIVKVIGIEAAMILAVILVLLGAYEAFEAGSLAASATAKALLSMSNSLIAGINTSIKDALKDVLTEKTDFDKEVEEKLTTLKEAQDLLETDNILVPFTIFGESPDSYFTRTVHYGNIGTLGVEAISSYVDRALTLPTLAKSVKMIEAMA